MKVLLYNFPLILSLWVKNSADGILTYFSKSSKKIGFDISCKLSLMETICMKCQNWFSRKSRKNIINLLSAELAQRMVKVNMSFCNYLCDGELGENRPALFKDSTRKSGRLGLALSWLLPLKQLTRVKRKSHHLWLVEIHISLYKSVGWFYVLSYNVLSLQNLSSKTDTAKTGKCTILNSAFFRYIEETIKKAKSSFHNTGEKWP